MSEEDEAIELTDSDMSVIDEVNAEYDFPDSEVETTPEPENDIGNRENTSEDVDNSVEQSTGTGYPRGELDNAARYYGLDPTKYSSDEALVNALEVVGQTQGQLQQWNQWYQGQQQQQAVPVDEMPGEDSDDSFSIDLSDDYDEGLKDSINRLASNMQQHYDSQIDNLNNVIQSQQYYVNQLHQQEVQDNAKSQIDTFSRSVQKLDNSNLFGDADYMSIDQDSQQARNMEKVYDQATLLATGYQAQGMDVPAMDDLVQQAYHMTFHNEIQQQSVQQSNDRLRAASARRLGSGASLSSQPAPAASDDPVDNPILRDFYENALRENGSL
tara:strand:- start:509 stop:1489 length:981 start_codon:yes stop_codon:yes gene_type:complete